MSRLTKDIREQMAQKLAEHRYKPEADALVALNRTLADRAYAHLYTPEIVAAMATVEESFKNVFERSDWGFRVNAGGYLVDLGGPLRSRHVRFTNNEHDGYKVIGRYATHNLTDETLIEDVKAFADRFQKFSDDCPTAYHEAMAVLNTISTSKKLAEAWPEAMPVIGDLVPAECRTLPALKVAEINARFGLPPEVEAAE